MKLFCITLFVLAHVIFAAQLQAAVKLEVPKPAEAANSFRDRISPQRPLPVLAQPARDNPAQELFDTNPSIESDPSILLDPDQPYPDINHFVAPAPEQPKKKPGIVSGVPHPDKPGVVVGPPPNGPSVAAPSTVGSRLGSSGTETKAFRGKCFRCCKVTKSILNESWPNSPTKACNVCKINKYLPPKRSGNCKEGKFLGFYHTPTDCFFERCHQMLLDRTRSCMCFWDTRSSGSAALAS